MSSTITTTSALSASSQATTNLPNNIFTGVSTSTLASQQTAIPTVRRPFGCGGGFETIDTINPACAMQATDQAAQRMISCCNGAPRVVYSSNCNIYCNAQGQTLEQLNRCLSTGSNGTYIGPVYCNRSGVSFSSLLPEETDSRSFTQTPSRTAAAGAGATSSAAAPVGLTGSLREGGVSYAAWATVVMLTVSGFAGMLM